MNIKNGKEKKIPPSRIVLQ